MEEVSPGWLRDGVEFQVRLRGYDAAQVDDLLDRVAGGIELLQQQLQDALLRAATAEGRIAEHAEADHALRRTLVLAQRTADEAIAEAHGAAADIRAEAAREAEAIVAGAHDEARRVAVDAQRALRDDLRALGQARDTLRADVDALGRLLTAERDRLHRLADTSFQLGDLPPVSAIEVPPAPDAPDAYEHPDAVPIGESEVDVRSDVTAGDDRDTPEAATGETDSGNGEPARVAAETEEDPSPEESASEATSADEALDEQAGIPDVVMIDSAPKVGVDDDLPVDVPDDLSTLDRHAPRDDPFLAELRKAHTDSEPLGPRDDELLEGFEAFDGEHDLGLERSWWGRRRRR